MDIQHDGNGYIDRRALRERERVPWVDPKIWTLRDMRYALAVHDIQTVYRLLGDAVDRLTDASTVSNY